MGIQEQKFSPNETIKFNTILIEIPTSSFSQHQRRWPTSPSMVCAQMQLTLHFEWALCACANALSPRGGAVCVREQPSRLRGGVLRQSDLKIDIEERQTTVLHLLKTCQMVFQSGCTFLHSHLWHVEIVISPHPHQHVSLSAFFITDPSGCDVQPIVVLCSLSFSLYFTLCF